MTSDMREPFQMQFDVNTIKHLGLQMYSTLPSVIGELVANGWDANATRVEITVPEGAVNESESEITVKDNGLGMSDSDIRKKYVIVGRDRREGDESETTPLPLNRRVMGRKGIGKFSGFGIAKEIGIESVHDDVVSHFRMNYDEMLERADDRSIEFPLIPPTGGTAEGTTITLRHLTKYRNRRIAIQPLRRRLARRFSVISAEEEFEVVVNGSPITVEERDLKRLLGKDSEGKPYLWEYENEEIKPETGWVVSGWIGALDRTDSEIDGVDRGIALMARGKLVQEPFLFDAVVGQQYALSYLVGEFHVEFVDDDDDTIGTSRNALVWDAEANEILKNWGQKKLNVIAREWAAKRGEDNRRKLEQHPLYVEFRDKASETQNRRAQSLADKLVRQTIDKNPTAPFEELEPVIQTSLDFIQFNAFLDIASDLADADLDNLAGILNLFREWEIVEAKEMARVTEGRITTIGKLQQLVEEDTLEIPTLHNFLREFPWVIDPRWTLVDDEVRYSELLREQFPESNETPESDRRIDFLCVRESSHLIVVEIKRPRYKATTKDLRQIEDYVVFVESQIGGTTDPDHRFEGVTGYLLCGDMVDTPDFRVRRNRIENNSIYIRKYSDLLRMVRNMHSEFLERYNALQEAQDRRRGEQ